MSPKKTTRARKTRQIARPSLRLEALEPRLPLTGNVTAQLSGSLLLLTGDAFDNQLIVSSAAGGKMAVIGAPGTTINGSTSPFVTSRAVSNIVANLNGGNDAIGFGNSALGFNNQVDFSGGTLLISVTDLQTAINNATGSTPTFSLPGSLSVTTGAGNDSVGIIGNVGGSVAANLGSALTGTNANFFVIGDPNVAKVSNRVGGAVSVVGGDQNDTVLINGTNVGGAVSLALGNGTNDADISGWGATIGSFAYTGGTGNDEVMVRHQITVRNDVAVFTGQRGEDEFGMYDDVSIGGSLVVNTGTGADYDYIDIGGTIRRDLSVITGGGNDDVFVLQSTIGGAVTLASNAGNDRIELSTSTVGLNTVIDAGAGNDEVVSSGLTTRNLFVSLGAGNDSLTLNNASAFAAFLYGGTGTNTLTTNAATRTGVRTLRSFQFQTVNNVA